MSEIQPDISQRPPPAPPNANSVELAALAKVRALYDQVLAPGQTTEPVRTLVLAPAAVTTKHRLHKFNNSNENFKILTNNLAKVISALGFDHNMRTTLWTIPYMRTAWERLSRLTANSMTLGIQGVTNSPTIPSPKTLWDATLKIVRCWERHRHEHGDDPLVPPDADDIEVILPDNTSFTGTPWNQQYDQDIPIKAIAVRTRDQDHVLVISPFYGPSANDRDNSTILFFNQTRTPILHKTWFLCWTDLIPILNGQPSPWEAQWSNLDDIESAILLRTARLQRPTLTDRILPGHSPVTESGRPRAEDPATRRIQEALTPSSHEPARPANNLSEDHQQHQRQQNQQTTPLPSSNANARAHSRDEAPDSLDARKEQANPNHQPRTMPLIAIMVDVEGMGLYTEVTSPHATPMKRTAVSEFAATISIPEEGTTLGAIHGLINENYPLAVLDQACYNTAKITGLPPLTFRRADGDNFHTPGLAFPSMRDCTDALVQLITRYEQQGHQVVLLAQDDTMEREVLSNPKYVEDTTFLTSRLSDISRIKPEDMTTRWKRAIERIRSAKTGQIHEYIKAHQSQPVAKTSCPYHKRAHPGYHCALADTLLYTGLLIEALKEHEPRKEQITLPNLGETLTTAANQLETSKANFRPEIFTSRGITPPDELERLYAEGTLLLGVDNPLTHEMDSGTSVRDFVADAVVITRDGKLDTLRERAAQRTPHRVLPPVGQIGNTSGVTANHTTRYTDQLSITDLIRLFPRDSELIGSVNRQDRPEIFNQTLYTHPWIQSRRHSAANVGYPNKGPAFPLYAQVIPPGWGVVEKAAARDRSDRKQLRPKDQPPSHGIVTTFMAENPIKMPTPAMKLWHQPTVYTHGYTLKRWTLRYDSCEPPTTNADRVPPDFGQYIADARKDMENERAGRTPDNIGRPAPRPQRWNPAPTQQASEPTPTPAPAQQATAKIQWGAPSRIHNPRPVMPQWKPQQPCQPPDPSPAPGQPASPPAETRATTPKEQKVEALESSIQKAKLAAQEEKARTQREIAKLQEDIKEQKQALTARDEVLQFLSRQMDRSGQDKANVTAENTQLKMTTSQLESQIQHLRYQLERTEKEATAHQQQANMLAEDKRRLEQQLFSLKTKAAVTIPVKRDNQYPPPTQPIDWTSLSTQPAQYTTPEDQAPIQATVDHRWQQGDTPPYMTALQPTLTTRPEAHPDTPHSTTQATGEHQAAAPTPAATGRPSVSQLLDKFTNNPEGLYEALRNGTASL